MDVQLILVPYDTGRRAWRCGSGPEHLLRAGLVAHLERKGHSVAGVQTIEADPEQSPAEIATAFDLMRRVAAAVRAARAADRFPLVLSGNCNAAVGALSGLTPSRRALFWFDAHGDLNTPETTESGFLDGTGLATALGLCWARLAASVPGYEPVGAEATFLLAARDLDPPEAALVARASIATVASPRIPADLQELLTRSGLERTVGYVHLDLDALDPAGVGRANSLPVPGGLSLGQLTGAIAAIACAGGSGRRGPRLLRSRLRPGRTGVPGGLCRDRGGADSPLKSRTEPTLLDSRRDRLDLGVLLRLRLRVYTRCPLLLRLRPCSRRSRAPRRCRDFHAGPAPLARRRGSAGRGARGAAATHRSRVACRDRRSWRGDCRGGGCRCAGARHQRAFATGAVRPPVQPGDAGGAVRGRGDHVPIHAHGPGCLRDARFGWMPTPVTMRRCSGSTAATWRGPGRWATPSSASSPGHLLGYVVLGTAAQWARDDAALAQAYRAFLSHYEGEMRASRPEYAEHRASLDEFRRRAGRRRLVRTPPRGANISDGVAVLLSAGACHESRSQVPDRCQHHRGERGSS